MPVDPVLQEIEQAGLALLADAGFSDTRSQRFHGKAIDASNNLIYWSFGDYRHWCRRPWKGQPKGEFIAPEGPRNPVVSTGRQITELTLIPDAQRPIEFMMNALRLAEEFLCRRQWNEPITLAICEGSLARTCEP